MSQPLIQAEHIFKEFRLHHRPQATLKEAVLNRLRGPVGRYEPFWALRDVSLSVSDGEVLGIIGPNGAGKTTLLGIIAGILQPTSGAVTVRGTCAALIGLGVGLDTQLTGRENAYLYGSVLGLPRREMARRMDEILEFAELGEFADAPMRTYSSGMTARLAFSVAINVTPEILLLDEVLAVGDIAFRQRCLDRMMSLRDRIRSIVTIAHQMDTIREWCDKVLWLEHGAVVAYGPADEVTLAYQEASAQATQAYQALSSARREASGRAGPRGVFDDVPRALHARCYIEAAYQRGIIEPHSTDDAGLRFFAPDGLVRRRDLARYLGRAAGLATLESEAPRFSDVPSSDPDSGWIERLADDASWPLTVGVSSALLQAGEFEPERGVTRAQMAAFICRALGKEPLIPGAPTFVDVPPAHPYFGFIERIGDPASWSEPPIVGSGTDERRFDPDGPVTRAQAAVIIARAWNLLADDEAACDDVG